MIDPIDKSTILDSFIAEVRSYLPRIKADLEGLIADPAQVELLEESHRLAHTVKNSSLMMGYSKLSKMAQPVEDLLRDIIEGKFELRSGAVSTIYHALDRTGAMLDSLEGDWVDEERLAQDNESEFRELRELMENDRAAQLQAAMRVLEVVAVREEPVADVEAPASAEQGAGLADTYAAESAEAASAEVSAVVAAEEDVADQAVQGARVEGQLAREEHEPDVEAPLVTEHWPAPGEAQAEGASLPQPGSEMVEEPTSGVAWERVEEALAQAVAVEPAVTAEAEEGWQASPTEQISAVGPPSVEAAVQFNRATELSADEPSAVSVDGNSFLAAMARLEDYKAYLNSIFARLQEYVSQADQIMASLATLKPTTMNMALLANRRYASTFSTAQTLATPLAGIAASIQDLMSNDTRLLNIATDLERATKALKQGGRTVVTSAADKAIGGLAPEQLAELRTAIEKEVKEALLQEMAADREMAEQQEAKIRERYEDELRARLEAEIRSELALQFAHAAQVTAPTTTRSIAVSASPEDEEDLSEELPQELVEAFTSEAEEHLLNIGRDLAELEKKSPDSVEIVSSIRRSVHTLKGAAATMGFRVTGELAHTLEDLLDEVSEGQLEIDDTVESLILDTVNGLEALVACIVAGQREDRGIFASLKPRYEGILSSVRASDGEPSAPAPEAAPLMVSEHAPAVKRSSLQVHVGIERLDEVVNLVGELVINRATFEQRMLGVKQALGELELSTSRLKRLSQNLSERYEVAALLRGDSLSSSAVLVEDKSARYAGGGNGGSKAGTRYKETPYHAEFDELELDRYTEFHRLTRELGESASDVGTIGGELESLMTQFDTVLTRQSRISSELQDKLMRVRLVPLSNLTPRLYRTVRNLALSQGKEVDLVLGGEEVEIDKTVFEGISDPLLHLMRNAMDHGIEPASVRRAAGKAEKGRVMLQAYYEGNQVVIKVSDDGRGIALANVRDAALARGFIRDEDRPSDSQLLDLLFQPGFSTATEVTETSGRGVGLDVVRTNVSQLRGTVQVASVPGEGTTFTIRLPLTLAVTRAQLIKSGNETFAVPLSQIEQIVRLGDQHLRTIGPKNVLTLQGQIYPVFKLSEALSLPEPLEQQAKNWVPVLISNTSSRQVSMVVDEILGQQEIVIKSLGDHFRSLKGISGATILGNGQVVLILNVSDLLSEAAAAAPIPAGDGSQQAPINLLDVLVVDDSPSVRRVISSMLQKAGLNPRAAKDGIEALELVQFERPDVILLDIEMPRMDGYELLSILRNQVAYRDIPVVMLTSRAGDKHRQKALQLGANGYLVKPYGDDELLAVLRNVAAAKPVSVS